MVLLGALRDRESHPLTTRFRRNADERTMQMSTDIKGLRDKLAADVEAKHAVALKAKAELDAAIAKL